MNNIPRLLTRYQRWVGTLLCVGAAAGLQALPVITQVVETGGDNEATDTIPAKFTGETWTVTQANEPIAGALVGDPFTVGVFGEEAPCFVDRNHQWNGATVDLPIPDYLVGAEYIMSGNDNRDNVDYRLDITVSEPAIIYMLIDNRYPDGTNTTPPNYAEGIDPLYWTTVLSWMGTEGFQPVMTGWNRTGDNTWPDEIGCDEGGNGVGPGGDIQQYASIYSKTVTAAGTVSIYAPDNAGRNMYGVVVKLAPGGINSPPEIKGVTPANNTLFHPVASGISFTATTVSPNSIAVAGIKLSLNGADVSSSLTVGGTTTSRSVTYSGLQADTIYSAQIIVSDQAGRSTTNSFAFDTFNAATAIAVEAEDYNYSSGQFLANPTPGAYANRPGTRDIDFHNNINNNVDASTVYRVGDFVGQAVTGDATRKAFTDAGATDHQLTTVLAGDWWNYTRSLADGNYRVYLRGSGTVAQGVRLDLVSGATTANQTVAALGTFTVAPGSSSFTYAPLADAAGNPVVVHLSGNTTLRLTALAASVNLQLNYLLLVPTTAAVSPAYLAEASAAAGAVNVAPDATVQLKLVNGAAAIDEASISLDFNGASVTSSIAKTPTANGVIVTYDPPGLLAMGAPQTVKLVFSETGGAPVTSEWSFNTVASIVTIPANYGTPLGTGQGTGFNFKIRKAANFDIYSEARTLANDTATRNLHLADQLIDADYEAPYANEAGGPSNNGLGTTTTINYDQDAGIGLPGGGFFGNEQPFPYIDLTGITDPADAYMPNNISMEFTTYLELAAGIHRFGVRSDDGFQLAVGPTFTQADATLVLGEFSGGRGDGLMGGVTESDFLVEQDGIYPIRMIYYEGNGGASVELYSIDRQTFQRTLINGTGAGAVKAYTSRSTQVYVPTVTITSPADNTVFAQAPANITITANASVVGGTITLVEFFQGSTKVGESTSAPFSVVWNGAKRGFYLLTAKATDNKGLTAVSAPVYVVVGQPLIANVVEIGGMAEPTDTVVATWTGQMFSNGVVGEFPDPIRVPPFGEEAPAYVDRIHQWNGVTAALPLPGYLVGGEYIMCGNDNRDAVGYQLDITLSQECLVYMLVDDRLADRSNANPPNYPDWTIDYNADLVPDMGWLPEQGWQAVTNGLNQTGNPAWPDQVGVDEGGDGVGPGVNIQQPSSVYVKKVPAGTFSIYAADNSGQNMYGVVVTTVGHAPAPPILNPPVLNGQTLSLTWTNGKLQEATNVAGPYTDVPGNPQGSFSVSVTGVPQKFYRVMGQ